MKSAFAKLFVILAIGCGIVFAADMLPAIRLLEFAAVFVTVAICLLAFVLVFTDIRTAMLGIAAAAICFSISYNHWPAQIRFKLSENQLAELLASQKNPLTIETPVWCGLYRIEKIELRANSTCFWTDLTPAGYTGLIYTPNDRKLMYFNIHKSIELDSNWDIISED